MISSLWGGATVQCTRRKSSSCNTTTTASASLQQRFGAVQNPSLPRPILTLSKALWGKGEVQKSLELRSWVAGDPFMFLFTMAKWALYWHVRSASVRTQGIGETQVIHQNRLTFVPLEKHTCKRIYTEPDSSCELEMMGCLGFNGISCATVSYTHLTLPTKD